MKAARAVAVVAVLVVAAVMAAGRPASADLLCLDKDGNFIACGQPTTPPNTLPPTTAPAPPPSSPPSTTSANPALGVALPDLDHSPPLGGGSRGPGLAGPIAVVDAALVAVLAFAVLERRRSTAVNA